MTEVRYEITAPNGREGVVAGIAFIAGRAVAEDPSPGALLYFRRHGYTLAPLDGPAPLTVGFTTDPPSAKPAPRSRSKQRGDAKEG
ncbi:hypothetical protein AB0H77_20245 [Streptomyces sp. NPDC050844]|uniref:hypothetical protein n=1 Tax=Streptomyces sp. NPDC050844 TaxID=3155790 RepID=UPI0033DAEF53